MGQELSFWDHFDSLRKTIFRILIAVVALSAIAFICKDQLFEVILAPYRPSFITYRFLDRLAEASPYLSAPDSHFSVDLISTQLTSQFLIHMSAAFYAGILLASPYIILQIFLFVSPALYANERRSMRKVIIYAFICFFAGILISYYLIFPFSFRFLATYQISSEIKPMITINSYIDTFMMLTLLMGFLFELPVVAWFFAQIGMLNDAFMKSHRKHALVIILIIVAIITPTTDIFTLILVSAPICILYEASIRIVRRVWKGKHQED